MMKMMKKQYILIILLFVIKNRLFQMKDLKEFVV